MICNKYFTKCNKCKKCYTKMSLLLHLQPPISCTSPLFHWVPGLGAAFAVGVFCVWYRLPAENDVFLPGLHMVYYL